MAKAVDDKKDNFFSKCVFKSFLLSKLFQTKKQTIVKQLNITKQIYFNYNYYKR